MPACSPVGGLKLDKDGENEDDISRSEQLAEVDRSSAHPHARYIEED